MPLLLFFAWRAGNHAQKRHHKEKVGIEKVGAREGRGVLVKRDFSKRNKPKPLSIINPITFHNEPNQI